MEIGSWDDWYTVEATARDWDRRLRVEGGDQARPESISVRLWVPEQAAYLVAAEWTDLDSDLRRGAAFFPSRRFTPRAFPFAPLLNLAEPINPLDGHLQVVTAERAGSLETWFEAVGQIIDFLTGAPTLFFMIRGAVRRVPYRLRIERVDSPEQADAEEEGTATDEPIEAAFSSRQAELIEAGRIARRITVDHPSGSKVVYEEFE